MNGSTIEYKTLPTVVDIIAIWFQMIRWYILKLK
jgi:hypothetical protein